ncbi:MAG: hypothetical protein ACR2JJ_05055 [Sphingomicrobium sp.]
MSDNTTGNTSDEIVIAGPVTVYRNEEHRRAVHAGDVALSAKQAAWHYLTERSDVEPEYKDRIEVALQLLAEAEQHIRQQMRGPDDLDARAAAQRLADANADDMGF